MGLLTVDQNELQEYGINLDDDDGDGRVGVDNASEVGESNRGEQEHIGEVQEHVPDFLNDVFGNDSLLDPIADDNEITVVEVSRLPAKVPKRDSRGRGRSLDNVWNYFARSPSDQATNKVQCKTCGKQVSAKVERLRAHMKIHSKPKTLVEVGTVSGRKSEPAADQIETEQPPAKVQKLRGFFDAMSQTEKSKLDMEVGRYHFATNLPFSHVEHPAFKRMMKLARPSYVTPSRRVLAGPILDRVYSDVKKERSADLSGKNVTLMQDGWKSRTSEPVIAHSVSTGDKAYFFNAISAEENKKTSEYCAQLLEKTILELENAGANVIAVVTDNCASMEKMKRIIAEKRKGIYVYGCHPHLLNLVGKRFTNEDILKKVQTIHTFFRNHDAALASLKKNHAPKPVLPSETRWNAWIKCLEYYVNHQSKLLNASRNPSSNVPEQVQDYLNDNTLYRNVVDTVKYLKPIQVALDKVSLVLTFVSTQTTNIIMLIIKIFVVASR